MEKKEAVKIESMSVFPDHFQSGYPLQGVFDSCEGDKSSLGFMELLGMQEFAPSLFDIPQVLQSGVQLAPITSKQLGSKLESSGAVIQPATPNSSSISSESSEALNDELPAKAVMDDNGDKEKQKVKKELKAKKSNQKRQRAPRVAFMTRSEVDHLEDGYRWRKYGQKAVKNSPFPRSYYRCTGASCNVKKRVERSFTDPSIVVTTYEGQHIHPSPVMPRPSFAAPAPDSGFSTFTMPMQSRLSLYQHHHNQHQPTFVTSSSPLMGFHHNGTTSNTASFLQGRRFCSAPSESALIKDHGLLQDVVPSHMLNED